MSFLPPPKIELIRCLPSWSSKDRSLLLTLIPAVRSFIGLYCRQRGLRLDESTTDDFMQETFLRVLIFEKRYDPKRSLKSWLFGIAKNVIRDGGREFRRRKLLKSMGSASRVPDPSEEMIADELENTVRVKLNPKAPRTPENKSRKKRSGKKEQQPGLWNRVAMSHLLDRLTKSESIDLYNVSSSYFDTAVSRARKIVGDLGSDYFD